MKVTIQAENKEEEKALKTKKIEYEKVSEFLMFGRHFDKKNALMPIDFEFWHGSYPSLIGKSYYFLKKLENLEKES